IDTLSRRLAFIRTWTYVAQRTGWVEDETYWREATRAVEDRLSDALHAALTQRFVDRRTSMLLRRLKQKETLVAEVNDKGEVTVEGEFAGRLEGFRFRVDKTQNPDEARMLNRASYEALRPEFNLRADRFYNAPDNELDFTEQGGLMWGDQAVGKLVRGADALRPSVEPFVDEEAGPEIADKVRRRLQHFIDRKITALFEPLLKMQSDETLTGLARGFAFRLVEHLGVIRRDAVAAEVKDLDQDARGLLRKHGVRFGQFTIFLPALLKPAPTRLRLVLWGLAEGLSEFPESPPPGLVTIPNIPDVPPGYYTLSGYHPAGDRAIRIDMLERLADMLRTQDTRGGFEANADMLSITGMTLEQFAGLMEGLGYAAEKGERPKTRAPEPEPAPAPEQEAEPDHEHPLTEEDSVLAAETRAKWEAEQEEKKRAEAEAEALAAAEAEAAAEDGASGEAAADGAPAAAEGAAAPAEGSASGEAATDEAAPGEGEAPSADAEPELETFYTFRWAPRPRNAGRRPHHARGDQGEDGKKPGRAARSGGKPGSGKDGDRGKHGGGEGGGRRPGGKQGGKKPGKPGHQGAKTYSARPEKKADPDSPFAILAQLKDRK
ncbi:MAG: disulfide oxidoreductase, partial [Paracoccus sp. (in: a-proteobacteria)]|nr:disulfide oxidoreductase [Paracoccus sp. (in: a-proteobacteria)]